MSPFVLWAIALFGFLAQAQLIPSHGKVSNHTAHRVTAHSPTNPRTARRLQLEDILRRQTTLDRVGELHPAPRLPVSKCPSGSAVCAGQT